MEELYSPWWQGPSACQGGQDFKLLAPEEMPKPIWATRVSAPSLWWFYSAGQMNSNYNCSLTPSPQRGRGEKIL